jgi:hypothetical protein
MKWTEAYEHSGWTIVVPVKLIHAIGAKGAILVAQLFYWSGKEQSGEGWIYKTQLDLENETGPANRFTTSPIRCSCPSLTIFRSGSVSVS